MERQIMLEDSGFSNHFELLDEFVHVLMPTPDSTPDTEHLRILIMDHTARNLHIGWVFSNVSIIGFNTLSILKHLLERVPKAHDIWPVSTRKWTHQPNNPSSQNANTNLVSKTTGIELLGVPGLRLYLLIRNGNIGPID